MSTDLVLYAQDRLAEMRTWANLHPTERRRRCLTALRDRDTATLQDLLIGYLKLKGARGTRISPNTERSYRAAIKVLVEVSARQGLSLVQPGDEFAALFMRDLEARGQRSATIRVRVAAIKLLYRAARWCNLDIPCPWDLTKTPRTGDAEIRHPYPETDVRRLLACPGAHLQVLVLLGAHAGLRAAEMCALSWSDIDLAQEHLIVRHGKGDRSRTVPMTPQLVTALRALPVQSSGVVLTRSYQELREWLVSACKLTRVEYRGLHALRHTAGTELYRATGDLLATSRLLGHKDTSTTQVYVHMSQTHLRSAVLKRASA